MLYFIASISLLITTGLLVLLVPIRPRFVITISAIAFAIVTLFFGFQTISYGSVGVVNYFGRTTESALKPGIHFLPPWASTIEYSTLRREFQFKGPAIARDNNTVVVEVGFATRLNPEYAWRIQTTAGSDYFDSLVRMAGMTAVRDGISQYPWTEAVTSDRGEVQQTIQDNFSRIIREQLSAAGMTEEEASKALIVAPVQMRSALPDKKVQNAVAERSASLQDLERQVTLTQIANEEANRRSKEGLGVTKLFEALPQEFTADEIATVLSALATKMRAEAMLKAVESGQIETLIMNGDTAGNVSHATGQMVTAQPGK